MRIEVENVVLNLLTEERRLEVTVETKDGRVIKFDHARIEKNNGNYPAWIEFVAHGVNNQYSVTHGEQRVQVTLPIHDEGDKLCVLEMFQC